MKPFKDDDGQEKANRWKESNRGDNSPGLSRNGGEPLETPQHEDQPTQGPKHSKSVGSDLPGFGIILKEV